MQHFFLSFAVAFILSPFSYYMGNVANKLKLPRITGYLLSGIVCGPSILGILSKETVLELSIVEGACLSIIGLASGVELNISEIAKHKRQVILITFGICLSTWIICYTTFISTCWMIPLQDGISPNLAKAISSLGATLMLARSPASAIAVLKEMGGKGPFSSLALAVVILKDVVVIVAYAVNIELVAATLASDHLSSLHLAYASTTASVAASATGLSLGGSSPLSSQSLLIPPTTNAAAAAAAAAPSSATAVAVQRTAATLSNPAFLSLPPPPPVYSPHY